MQISNIIKDKGLNIKINTEKQMRIRCKLTGPTIRLIGAKANLIFAGFRYDTM